MNSLVDYYRYLLRDSSDDLLTLAHMLAVLEAKADDLERCLTGRRVSYQVDHQKRIYTLLRGSYDTHLTIANMIVKLEERHDYLERLLNEK